MDYATYTAISIVKEQLVNLGVDFGPISDKDKDRFEMIVVPEMKFTEFLLKKIR